MARRRARDGRDDRRRGPRRDDRHAGRGGTGGGTRRHRRQHRGTRRDDRQRGTRRHRRRHRGHRRRGGGGTGGGLPCPGIGTFDTTDLEGFALNMFMGTAAGAAINLAAVEAGTQGDARARQRDGGRPGAGLAEGRRAVHRLQPVRRHPAGYGATMLQNWTGYKLHVRVKVIGREPERDEPDGHPALRQHGHELRAATAASTSTSSPGTAGTTTSSISSTCAARQSDASMVIAFGVSIQAGDGSTATAASTR